MIGYRILSFFLLFVTLFDRSWGEIWVKDIGVSYTDASTDYRGENCLPEDINKGFGGKYVWLCPILTNVSTEAATSFRLIVQNDSLPYADLAKGTGGSFRYLLPMYDATMKFKVNNIWLAETESGEGSSGDINQGRGGRSLFLNWHLDSGDNEKTTTSEKPIPETTEAITSTLPTQEILEIYYSDSVVPKIPVCNCDCDTPQLQLAQIILISLLCLMSFIFGRFIYPSMCKRTTPASISDKSIYPMK